jgi:MFS superfamily sulfate permease-like transporter
MGFGCLYKALMYLYCRVSGPVGGMFVVVVVVLSESPNAQVFFSLFCPVLLLLAGVFLFLRRRPVSPSRDEAEHALE